MKKIYLLDTNIISEFSKESPNRQVLAFYAVRKDLCAISAITWQELTRGVQRLPHGRKRKYLECCLSNYGESFEVLPYDKFSAQICGEIQADDHGSDQKKQYFFHSLLQLTAGV